MTNARRRVARAAVAAERCQFVFAVDVLSPDADPVDRWTLTLLVSESQERPGVPWPVAEIVAEHRLSLHDFGRQGPDYYEVLALA